MSSKSLLILIAICFQLIGTFCLISKPAIKYFRGYILKNEIIKKEIEDEAIGTTFSRWASGDRQENLSDSLARGFITTYKSTFFGFLFIAIGFVMQVIALFIKK